MSTQHAQHYCPLKSFDYTSLSHTSLSCHSVITQRGSLNRSLVTVSCQSSLPHLSACCRSAVPERPRIPLNDSSAQHATSAADKFGSIPVSLICSHRLPLGLHSCPCVSSGCHSPDLYDFFLFLYAGIVFNLSLFVVKVTKVHTCFVTWTSWQRNWKQTTAGGETWHSPPCQRFPALVTHYERSTAEMFSVLQMWFSGNSLWDVLTRCTLWDWGSGMKSLSHNQSLQGAEDIYNKWFKMGRLHKNTDIIRAYRLTSLTKSRPPLQCD